MAAVCAAARFFCTDTAAVAGAGAEMLKFKILHDVLRRLRRDDPELYELKLFEWDYVASLGDDKGEPNLDIETAPEVLFTLGVTVDEPATATTPATASQLRGGAHHQPCTSGTTLYRSTTGHAYMHAVNYKIYSGHGDSGSGNYKIYSGHGEHDLLRRLRRDDPAELHELSREKVSRADKVAIKIIK